MLILVENHNDKLSAVGIADSDAAHRNGWCHTTVIAVPVLAGTTPPVILLYRRGNNRKSSPGTLDLGGSGHVEVFEPGFDLKTFNLESVILQNAIREAQEEIRDELRPDRPYEFVADDFRRFGQLGEWSNTSLNNHEMSTLHFIRLPNNRNWVIGDGNQGYETSVKFTLDGLMNSFLRSPEDFADGVGRVLFKLSQDPDLRARFETELCAIGQLGAQMSRYKVLWEDFEDCRSGDPFYVEATSLREAHTEAVEYIWRLSYKHIGAVEALVDEDGKIHLPQFYLYEEGN